MKAVVTYPTIADAVSRYEQDIEQYRKQLAEQLSLLRMERTPRGTTKAEVRRRLAEYRGRIIELERVARELRCSFIEGYQPASVEWAGRKFGELTPDERRQVTQEAAAKLKVELTAMAPAIAEVLETNDQEEASGE